MTRKFKIALSAGCPQGIGPEIAASAFKKLKDKYDIKIFENSRSFAALEAATDAVIAGEYDALVTCPISKYNWHSAGIPYTGHTEYLAAKTGVTEYAMMMASPKLKVTLATIHEPVKKIAKSLTRKKIVTASRLTFKALREYFGIAHPRLAVTALNPHCGDGGLLGDEEETIIRPAIDELAGNDINASGPFSADAVFYKAINGDYDAVVAMYHDQGLAVIKTLDNKNTVNITLGLPIIRTSVDHGTAEDIAGKGIADDANLIAAIEMATYMSLRGAK